MTKHPGRMVAAIGDRTVSILDLTRSYTQVRMIARFGAFQGVSTPPECLNRAAVERRATLCGSGSGL